MQQAAALGGGEHRDGAGGAGGAEVGALQRIDRDVDLQGRAVALVGADLLADVEHRRLVALALADDDAAGHRQRVELGAHRLHRHLVGAVTVAVAHGVGGRDRGFFGDADERLLELGVDAHERSGTACGAGSVAGAGGL